MGFGLAEISALPSRVIEYYVGPADKDSMEYWKRFTFYVIALVGVVAGTVCIVPACAWFFYTGRPYGAVFLVPYAVAVPAVLNRRISIRANTIIIAASFYFVGVASLVIAGPEGESGIWFSVSVLILSLFIGFKASFLMACIDFATGMVFAAMHANGLIEWNVLKDFKFFSWVILCTNIFLMDLTFAAANAILIRGVGRSFESLRDAEEKVRGFLAEKETLIREIYHRSKNNMQVVTSILRLNSSKLSDQDSKAVFRDVINKIGSMSLVHQRLYETQDLSRIGMAGYVGELVDLLVTSYGPAPGKVAIDLDIEDISMQIDMAIPCGLIISEIVSNSLKYAFPGDRRGRISIAMSREGADDVALRISDDGVGVPEGFVAESGRSMGMNTVFTIVTHQMQGNIEFGSAGGASYDIRFKLSLYDERVKSDA